MRPIIRVIRVDGSSVNLPSYGTEHSSGVDLSASISGPMALEPGERALIPTGLAMAIPAGYEGQIRPRSGLALKHGVTVANSPGTIDSDYRGELKVLLVNLGRERFWVGPGDRIAQLVVAPAVQSTFELVAALDDTERGEGGFGSTGV